MDFKWILILVLLIFGAAIYYNEDLRRLGSADSGSEKDLNSVESRPAQTVITGGDEPSTPKN